MNKMYSVESVVRVESADGIPDGEYSGRWSANVVRWTTEFSCYKGLTADLYQVLGLKSTPCTVTVVCGQFSVQATLHCPQCGKDDIALRCSESDLDTPGGLWTNPVCCGSCNWSGIKGDLIDKREANAMKADG